MPIPFARIASFMGAPVSKLLTAPELSHRTPTRSVDDEDGEVRYEYEGRGLELICDEQERVATIFFHADGEESLAELPFSLTRRQVHARLGAPAKTGEPRIDAILGAYGAWDRFERDGITLHVQYSAHNEMIEMLTIMRPDRVP